MSFSIRSATSDDAQVIHQFIVALAVYEREPVEIVEATVSSLRAQLQSDQPPFECLIGEFAGTPVGFALYFQSFSTWSGLPGIYLEDLFVLPDHRGSGFGAALLSRLAAVAVEKGCARLDWQVLDWNQPSIDFYEAIGSGIRRDWIPCRLDGDALTAMASRASRA